MSNPTGINQYTKIGGNRAKTRKAQASAKSNVTVRKGFESLARSVSAAKRKSGNSRALGNASAAAAIGMAATQNKYRRK